MDFFIVLFSFQSVPLKRRLIHVAYSCTAVWEYCDNGAANDHFPKLFISCGYTCLLPKVTLWVIALGWDRFGFPVRFSPPVTLQIITQGQLLTWQYLEGNLIHHGDRKPRNIRLACGCTSVLLLIRQYPVDLAIQNFVL